MTLRILHTADWQLGMTRHFLAGEAQARYAADRLEAVRRLLRIAADERCEAVVVAGDVFETNQVDRRTVAQTNDALRASSVPVFLLPGNHDPLDAASVFRSRTFLSSKPDHVHVLDTPEPRRLASGAEIAGAPWTSKLPLADLVAEAAKGLPPADRPRVLVAHGAVDSVSFTDRDDPSVISRAAAERAISERRFDYLALGDRHSPTEVGKTGRIWYAGSQETTDFDEVDAGTVLVVEVDAAACRVERRRVGSWTFRREQFELVSDDDVTLVERRFAGFADKMRTVAKFGFRGALTLQQRARLDEVVEEARHLLAAVVLWERTSDLVVRPEANDFAGLDIEGFARRAADVLRERAAGTGPEAEDARGALSLLFRLAGRRA